MRGQAIMDLDSLIGGVFVLGMAFGQAVSMFIETYIDRAAGPVRRPIGQADRK